MIRETLLLLCVLPLAVTEFPIDNEIVGEPSVDCEDALVGLTFKTKKPFTGRVYVQGLSDDDRCSNAFVDNRNMSRMSMQVKTGDCTMQRHRVTGKLEGLMYSVTVVVSFHGTFVTKADRAFRCICFFRNQKKLKNSIQIAPLGTTELLNPMAPPSCSYEIRSGSPDGPPVVYGEIGAKIFHIWHCDAPGKGFLVHSCKVTDGRGFQFDLLDVDGCAVDPVIQPDLKYNDKTNTAIAETYGYKFSDTNVLNYECVVEICSRAMGECKEITPPRCDRDEHQPNRVLRRRRAVPTDLGSVEVAASISMVDSMKEDLVKDETVTEKVVEELKEVMDETESVLSAAQKEEESAKKNVKLCFNLIEVMLLATVLIFLLCGMVIMIAFKSRVHKYTFNHGRGAVMPISKDESHVANISISSNSI